VYIALGTYVILIPFTSFRGIDFLFRLFPTKDFQTLSKFAFAGFFIRIPAGHEIATKYNLESSCKIHPVNGTTNQD
jgi:hypothetical protein